MSYWTRWRRVSRSVSNELAALSGQLTESCNTESVAVVEYITAVPSPSVDDASALLDCGAPMTNETEITSANEGVIEYRGQNSCSDYAEIGTYSEYEEGKRHRTAVTLVLHLTVI
jgi:hypothetical protein